MPYELTALERLVIALSHNDPATSLKPQGPLARWIYGRSARPLSLANPRLEALRRYAILHRTDAGTLARQEAEQLRLAGYDQHRIAQIDRLLAPYRPHQQFLEPISGESGRPAFSNQ